MITVNDNIVILDSLWPSADDRFDFENAIIKLINEGNKEICIDISKPEYLPSEIIGFIMWKKRELSNAGKNLKIHNISRSLLILFKQAQILQFLGLEEPTDE